MQASEKQISYRERKEPVNMFKQTVESEILIAKPVRGIRWETFPGSAL